MEGTKPLKLKGYDRDEELVKHGALVNMGANDDGTVRVARIKPLNSTAYEDRLAALRRRHPRAGERDPEIERGDQRHAMAEKVLVELVDGECEMSSGEKVISRWLDVDGNVIEDTFENRRALLIDRDFFQDVVFAAAARETFRREQVEADLGNASSSSTGA